MSAISLSTFDPWLQDSGPAALVLREPLMPVEGHDGVFFPATYAASEDGKFGGGYNIDSRGDAGNVCLVDSVGSQANRMEPVFATEGYAELVPQIVVKAGDRKVHLLEAGHRAGDAIVRCSALQEELQEAFKADLKGDAEPLAKIAPTSLVFGVWDSRDTQDKKPRLVASTIRAYNVDPLKRSAQYVPATEYIKDALLDDPAGDKKLKDAYSTRGFIHVPASGSHGGVIARGGVRREATLHLAALRFLSAKDADRTLALRRYVLGLALTAFTYSPTGYLRQGCNLVPDPDKPREFKTVHRDGRREDAAVPGAASPLTHEVALAFAKAAAKAFGVGASREVEFDKERAKKDIAGDEGGKGAKKTKSKGG